MRKEIIKEALQLKLDCVFLVEDGSRVRFWEDKWCREDPLCVRSPALYTLANSNGARVKEV